jgi:excisionase family DNA binding protein
MAVTLDATEDRLRLAATPTERRQAQSVMKTNERAALESWRSPAPIPQELADLLAQVIAAVASGATVSIGAVPEELTTTEAAKQLGVSRPTLMRMIHDGEIESRLAGTHHRVRTADVLAVKRARLASQRKAFDELRELEDQLDNTR